MTLFARVKRMLTGPTQAELEADGYRPADRQPPHVIDPPVPYKPGTTEPRWPTGK